MAEKSIAETVETLVVPVTDGLGVELYELEYVKERGQWILRIFIDKPDGVSIDDCERVSHAIEKILDADEPINGPYTLEVSSPGIERTLTRPSHFMKYVGKAAEVRLYKPVDGKKRYTGILNGLEGDTIVLEVRHSEENIIMRFERDIVSLCRLVFFDVNGNLGDKKGGNRKNG